MYIPGSSRFTSRAPNALSANRPSAASTGVDNLTMVCEMYLLGKRVGEANELQYRITRKGSRNNGK